LYPAKQFGLINQFCSPIPGGLRQSEAPAHIPRSYKPIQIKSFTIM
jgi:hypothetical protein